MKNLRRWLVLGVCGIAAVTAASSDASTVIGLTETSNLVAFDSASPGTLILGPTPITGVAAGFVVRGIDYRPATGQLYAIARSGTQVQIYILDPVTAVATAVGSATDLGVNVNLFDFGFDFNPVVDRIRLVSRSNDNFRFNPDDGSAIFPDTNVAYLAGDPNFGADPGIEGAAYTNNVAGAATTTLFVYDYSLNILARQGGANGTPSPNTGQLTTIGASGISAGGTVGLDVTPDGTAFLQDFTRFLTVNLSTGAATLVGTFVGAGNVRDIAAIAGPQPGPALTVKGGKKISTEKSVLRLKGTAAGSVPPALVEIKVGKKPFKAATGVAKWKAKIHLATGRNKVRVRATDLFGQISPETKVTITRL